MLVCPAVFEIPMALSGGHDLRPVVGADLGGVFAVADVADVVQRLGLPMDADPGGELGGGGLVGVQAPRWATATTRTSGKPTRTRSATGSGTSPPASPVHGLQRLLKISPDWPWKEAFLACWQRLCALPAPA